LLQSDFVKADKKLHEMYRGETDIIREKYRYNAAVFSIFNLLKHNENSPCHGDV
jgi:hypothetical protein